MSNAVTSEILSKATRNFENWFRIRVIAMTASTILLLYYYCHVIAAATMITTMNMQLLKSPKYFYLD